MTVLSNRSLNGRLFGLTLPIVGVAPSQVTSLSVGSVSTRTIVVSYAAATGTAPITYSAYTSLHGASNWVANAGSFSAAGGTFTGLTASTAYDLRIVATNAYGSSTTDLTVGTTTSAAATAPSQVTNFTSGVTTTSTIQVSYTAATGTAPITYAGYTSPHGTNTWTQNAGTFSATGGQFTGLAASTSYDLQIVATNSAGSSTTNLLSGTVTASPGSGGLVVMISEDANQGDAQYTLVLDGAQQGATRTASVAHSSGNAESVAVATSLTAGTHSLIVTFLNDLYSGPGADRNLWINSATYNGATIRYSSSLLGSTGSQLVIGFTIGSDGNLTAESIDGYVEPAPAVSNAANRYDIVPAASNTAVGTSVSVSFYPNGTWNGETLTPTAASGAGTFSPSTITTTSGSSAAATCTYTPTVAGEHYIATTNSGSLYNPYSAPLNVYATSSGTAATIAAAIASGMDQQPHQFDTLSGNSGFSFSGAKGWGEVWVNLTSLSTATGGLFIKLYDALSTGATSTTGTGTVLNANPVQVYGTVSATGTKRLLLPASPYIYYADIATDAAFTNPVRIPQRFAVGLGIGVIGRSQEAGVIQWWDDTTASGETWNRTICRYTNDYRYGAGGVWCRSTGAATTDGGSNEPNSAGAQVAGRIVNATMGVSTFLVGVAAGIGGGIDEYLNTDGSLSQAFRDTISGSGMHNKFRWLWAASLSGWDGSTGENYFEVQRRFLAAPDWVARTYPTCAVQGWGAGATGRPEPTGSAPTGPTRLQQTFLQRLEPVNPMVVSKENYCWAAFKYDHGNNSSKRLYVQSGIRQLLSAELAVFGGLQTQNRGPTLASTGTIAGISRVIRLPYKLNGGSALQTTTITQINPNYTVATGAATPSNLASLVAVYRRGAYAGKSYPALISGVAINTSSVPVGYDGTLDVTLAGSSGVSWADGTNSSSLPSDGFSVQFAADLQASGGDGYTIVNTTAEPPAASSFSMITDNQVSGPWEFGRHIRPKCDISISVV